MSDRRPTEISNKLGKGPIQWITPRVGVCEMKTKIIGQVLPLMVLWNGKAPALIAPLDGGHGAAHINLLCSAVQLLANDVRDLHARIADLEKARA